MDDWSVSFDKCLCQGERESVLHGYGYLQTPKTHKHSGLFYKPVNINELGTGDWRRRGEGPECGIGQELGPTLSIGGPACTTRADSPVPNLIGGT